MGNGDPLTILQGDALEKLRELPKESVQCCCTSPPFWGLRDYGTAKWEGGDDNCDHTAPIESGQGANKGNSKTHPGRFIDCKCGARRTDAQLGLEKTPEEYVAKLVEVFREVRRVLRNDGTLWLNLGDSYASSGGFNDSTALTRNRELSHMNGAQSRARYSSAEIKPKDLVGIPWAVAFALRADGWWLRSDIIWAKPNPMPESVTDRPTKSHEYIFLLTKSARYFYDAAAIKEPSTENDWQSRYDRTVDGHKSNPDEKPSGLRVRGDHWHGSIPGREDGPGQERRQVRSPAGWDTGSGAHGTIHRNGREQEITYNEIPNNRNKRSVWTVATAPYPEAHFATYPPDLIKPCILAGTRVGDTVLDPFAGSGTTGMVAIELGRKALLIELNPNYVQLIEQRCNVTPGLALA